MNARPPSHVVLHAVSADDARTHRETVRVDVTDRPPYTLRLHRASGATHTFTDDLVIACLRKARRLLEAEGLLLCCQGARPDVTPSGLENQFSGGRYVHIFTPGARRVSGEYADILAPAAPEEITTLAAQRAAVFAFHGLPDPGSDPDPAPGPG